MSVATFKSEVWSARILDSLQKSLVYGNLVNRDYEGDIMEQGNTVHINSLGDISVKTYTPGTDIDAAEDLNTTDQELVIDQADYFNFRIDDVDAAQVAGDLLDTASNRTGYIFADKADAYIASILAAGTLVTGLGTSDIPLAITTDNAYDTLVKMKILLDKANTPTDGRWVVVPPEFEGAMLGDARFAGPSSTQSEASLMNGAIARAAGFTIYESNNCPVTSSKYSIIASSPVCATYADQINKTEAYRPEGGFRDAVKGLHLYGAKLTRAGNVAVATCTF